MAQVLPGVCTEQIYHTLSWHSEKMTTAMLPEIRVKFDIKYSCKMSQVTCTVRQSIVSAGALLTRRQKMFCQCPLRGKEISDIRFRCEEKMFSMLRLNKTRGRIVK